MKIRKRDTFIAVSFFLVGFLLSYNIYHLSKTTSPAVNTNVKELFMELPVDISSNVSKDDQEEIKKFVYGFENERKHSDAFKIMNYFTPPVIKDNKDELDFIMGTDISSKHSPDSPRLFTTGQFENWVGKSTIKSINKKGDVIVVKLNEIRISYFPLVEPTAEVGYYAKVLPVTIEVKNTSQGLKIDKYYQDATIDVLKLKYDGLYS